MKFLQSVLLFALIVFCVSGFSQTELHRWKKLDISGKKMWYDEANLDSAGTDHIDVWVLEQYTPPLVMEELSGKVYRSKTLYTISLKTAKYGIMRIIYLDSYNTELHNFDYEISDMQDQYKYIYPVIENSFLHKILRAYFKLKGVSEN